MKLLFLLLITVIKNVGIDIPYAISNRLRQ